MNLLSHRNYLDQFTAQEINESFLWLASMLLVILQTVHFKMWGCPCVDTVRWVAVRGDWRPREWELNRGQRWQDKPRQHINSQRHHFASKGPYSWSYGFSSDHVWMWEMDHKEGWVLKNWCFWTVVFGGDSWESLGQQDDQTSQSERKSVLNIHWKDWCWSSNPLAAWWEEPTHLKRPWGWERLKGNREVGTEDEMVR